MKCINNLLLLLTCLISLCVLTGCGAEPEYRYEEAKAVAAFSFTDTGEGSAEGFAENLCVCASDEGSIAETEEGRDMYASAGLFNITDGQTIYSRDIFKRLYPASMTKVMTALLVAESCSNNEISPDSLITCSENVEIKEKDAQLCGFKAGDTMTLDEAMHGLLMYSGNDAAVLIAESISGSVEAFAQKMNDKALSLGATGTHFVNPHGLSDEEHYTTPYDMYLIFNEAVKYQWIRDIMNCPEYTYSYTRADGSSKELTFNTTNYYLKGDRKVPEGVSVIGGKTGTTLAAGNNLVLLSMREDSGKEYISIVMRADTRDDLYKKMTTLLEAE